MTAHSRIIYPLIILLHYILLLLPGKRASDVSRFGGVFGAPSSASQTRIPHTSWPISSATARCSRGSGYETQAKRPPSSGANDRHRSDEVTKQ